MRGENREVIVYVRVRQPRAQREAGGKGAGREWHAGMGVQRGKRKGRKRQG